MNTSRHLVEKIISLNWQALSVRELQSLMVLSAYAAREFGQSLRVALSTNHGNKALAEMAAGELHTDNLKFDNYAQTGDHADFLWFFIRKYDLMGSCPASVFRAGEQYFQQIVAMSPEVRTMSIVSREHELPGIFTKILEAKIWDAPELKAFRYYLMRHIELDSGDQGHAAMLSKFAVDDRVGDFYSTRLNMYEVIPTLFS